MDDQKWYWGYATKSFTDTLICDELSEEESEVYCKENAYRKEELNFDE